MGEHLNGVETIAEARYQGTDPSSAHLKNRITELEAEVRELRSVETELTAMFNAMVDLVLVLDRDGRYCKIAPTAPDLLYRPSDEVLGLRMHDLFPKEQADFFLGKVHSALASQSVVNMEYSLAIGDKEIFFAANISPLSEDTVVLVARDVTPIKRAALREKVFHEEIIRAQEEALAEIGTPLVPISDRVVALPLVGTLETKRMARVMTTLLDGIQSHRAQAAIVDITGVPEVNAEAARSLVDTARAVRLLGARVILTGIRPEVARMLTEMKADLAGIVTCGTLQAGIAVAMTPEHGRGW